MQMNSKLPRAVLMHWTDVCGENTFNSGWCIVVIGIDFRKRVLKYASFSLNSYHIRHYPSLRLLVIKEVVAG